MYFGAHVSTSGGIDKAAERAVELGAEAMQVFTQSPRMWRPQTHPDEKIARFRELCADGGVKTAVAHAIYLINLASDNPDVYDKSRAALTGSIEAGERI